jgi:hypothetical protein
MPFLLRFKFLIVLVIVCTSALAGCHWIHGPKGSSLPLAPENPFFVPVSDRDFAWNQIVDSIDDYFKIDRERRVRDIGGALTEGRIDTFPTVGSSILEPWRKDSVGAFERLHASLQSIRRQAVVRVIPHEHGYLIDVQVYKELEDVQQPIHGADGSRLERHDGTLIQSRDRVDGGPGTLGWIPLGRDMALEQRIVSQIQSRLVPGNQTH